MWLLNTATAELHEFVGPEKVPDPGYAILSHVWQKDPKEQSFQEVKAIGERCKLSGENPRDLVSEKIRRCCEIAAEEGYKWVWIDTCCIDKTSSAELSEAINSMFRYYTLSAVCFVYLHNVVHRDHAEYPDIERDAEHPDFETRDSEDSDFESDSEDSDSEMDSDSERGAEHSNSERGAEHPDGLDMEMYTLLEPCIWWHRGWTLQELIAPTVVILLSQSWTLIGSKNTLAATVEKLTGIPAPLLRRETHLSNYSVAQRMSWAARRETTRIEDEAYCLLGIFDISMPTLYGEGRRAFQRLQEEIMRTRLDTTLFAWGVYTAHQVFPFRDHAPTPDIFPLLAHAPSDFYGCSTMVHCPNSNAPQDSMSFQITPHGILARVPFLEYEGKTFIDLSYKWHQTPVYLCVEQLTSDGIYSVVKSNLTGFMPHRACVKDTARTLPLLPPLPPLPRGEMTEIHIANNMSNWDSPTTVGSIVFPCNGSPRAPFHFSVTLGDHPSDPLQLVHAQDVDESWDGDCPAVLYIHFQRWLNSLNVIWFVICGICTAQTSTIASLFDEPPSRIHWARVSSVIATGDQNAKSFSPPDGHDCTKDHITDWPDRTRLFRGQQVAGGLTRDPIPWEVTLVFGKSNMYPNIPVLRSVTVDSEPVEWEYA